MCGRIIHRRVHSRVRTVLFFLFSSSCLGTLTDFLYSSPVASHTKIGHFLFQHITLPWLVAPLPLMPIFCAFRISCEGELYLSKIMHSILRCILHAILAGLWMLANCQFNTINCYCHQVTSAAVKLGPGKTLYPPVHYCGRPNLSSLVLIHSLRPRVLPPIYLSAAGIPLYDDATPIATRFLSIRRRGELSTLGWHHLDRNLCLSASNYVLRLSANINLLVIGSFAYTSKSLHNF